MTKKKKLSHHSIRNLIYSVLYHTLSISTDAILFIQRIFLFLPLAYSLFSLRHLKLSSEAWLSKTRYLSLETNFPMHDQTHDTHSHFSSTLCRHRHRAGPTLPHVYTGCVARMPLTSGQRAQRWASGEKAAESLETVWDAYYVNVMVSANVFQEPVHTSHAQEKSYDQEYVCCFASF